MAAWLSACLGHPWPVGLTRGLLLVVGLEAARRLALGALRAWQSDPTWQGSRILLLLLGASLFVRWVGISHEVGERFYLDEGTYVNRAQRANAGELLQTRFAYPHLLYYLYAFAFWIADQWRFLLEPWVRWLVGSLEGAVFNRLIGRVVAAAVAAAAVWPSFRLGERLAGRWAATAAGVLMVAAPLFNRDAHVLISDVPSATLAGFCLLALLRLDREAGKEPLGPYAVAGFFAGLAAATKYPAGVVAVAIVGEWSIRRWRKRNWSWGLPLAGAVAIAAFVGAMPSLLVHWRTAWTSDQGLLFGLRQYGGGGWFGVVRQSDALYYLGELRDNWGWTALMLGALGVAILIVRRQPALPAMAIFPLVYFVLICSMSMSVSRNLHPILIPLSAFVGAGLVTLGNACMARLWGRWPVGARRLRVLVVLGALLPPVVSTGFQSASYARPGTRVLARQWIEANLPEGSVLVRESYTPTFKQSRIVVREAPHRFLSNFPLSDLQAQGVDYVLVSSGAFGRYFKDDLVAATERPEDARRYYETVFREFEKVAEWKPSLIRDGPHVLLYRAPWAENEEGPGD